MSILYKIQNKTKQNWPKPFNKQYIKKNTNFNKTIINRERERGQR